MSHLCHYCERPMIKPRNGQREQENWLTRDHILPRVYGGNGTPTVRCCLRCNRLRSDGDYEEFKLFANLLLKGRSGLGVDRAGLMWKAWQIRALI